MDIQDLAHELYGLPCEEFGEVRDARAAALRTSGEDELAGQVAGLPEPSSSAWALNMLVRHRPDRIQKVLALGADLRAERAQHRTGRLRRLERRQRRLAAKVAREVQSLAEELGHPVDGQASGEVEQTLCVAMTDRDAACALSSGLMVGTFPAGGSGAVDAGRAVAVPDEVSLPGAQRDCGEPTAYDDEPDRARDQAHSGLDEARRELDEAAAGAQAARREVELIRDRRARMAAEEGELSRRLHHLRRDIARSDRAQKIAERAWRKAGRREAAAKRALQRSSALVRRRKMR